MPPGGNSDARQRRLTLVATILGSTVVFLDSTVINVALPTIGDGLDTGLAGKQWVVEAYMLTLVALLLVGGSLGDQFGRRRLFLIGLAGFGATSALGALAPSIELLVAARGLQGSPGRCWSPARWRSSPPPSRGPSGAGRSGPGPPGRGSPRCSARPAAAP
ncbi:MAG: MFS transporter [Solirubrobacterales bacterium]